jgi:hypothetical protein
MIEGFEEFTEDVKEEDIEVINMIVRGLEIRVGIEKAITNADMRSLLYLNRGVNVSGAKMRRHIQYIRAYRLISMLCGGKKGYYVARNVEEWIKYREGFRSRMRSMEFTLRCMDLDEVENNVLK